MVGNSPKKRSNDVTVEDTHTAEREHKSADSTIARSSVLETPFRYNSEQDFDGNRREDSHYATSTSGAHNHQHDNAEW